MPYGIALLKGIANFAALKKIKPTANSIKEIAAVTKNTTE